MNTIYDLCMCVCFVGVAFVEIYLLISLLEFSCCFCRCRCCCCLVFKPSRLLVRTQLRHEMRPLSVFMNETHSHTDRERERESRPHTHTHAHTREALPLLGWHAPQSQSGRKFENPKSSQRARARARLRGELARHSAHTHTQTRNSDAGNQSADASPPCGAAIFAAHAQSNQSTVCQARRRLPCECRCACARRVVNCGELPLLISLSLSLLLL